MQQTNVTRSTIITTTAIHIFQSGTFSGCSLLLLPPMVGNPVFPGGRNPGPTLPVSGVPLASNAIVNLLLARGREGERHRERERE